jgi:hypothetical protein
MHYLHKFRLFLNNLKSFFRYASERIFLIFCLRIVRPFIEIFTAIFMLRNTCSSSFTYFLSDLSFQCSYRKDQKLLFLVDLGEIDASLSFVGFLAKETNYVMYLF